MLGHKTACHLSWNPRSCVWNLSLPSLLFSTASCCSSLPLIARVWSTAFSNEVQILFLSFYYYYHFVVVISFPPVCSHFSPLTFSSLSSRLFFLLHLKKIIGCNISRIVWQVSVYASNFSLLVWRWLKGRKWASATFPFLAPTTVGPATYHVLNN